MEYKKISPLNVSSNAGSGVIRQVRYGETFRTIKDICNECFGTNYKGLQKSYFIPKTLKQEYDDKYILWTPNVIGEPIEGWVNSFKQNEDIMEEYNRNDRYAREDELHKAKYRVTFTKDCLKPLRYRFVGVYKFDKFDIDHKRIWRRVSMEFPL